MFDMKIIVIQQSDCKGNFNKTIYPPIYLSIQTTSGPAILCQTASVLGRLSLRYQAANVAKKLNKNGLRLINIYTVYAIAVLFFKNQRKLC